MCIKICPKLSIQLLIFLSFSWTPAVLGWTSPTKQEIVHNWVIKGIGDLILNPKKAVESSNFSNLGFRLQAKLKEESLLLCGITSELLLVTDCSFSIRSLTSCPSTMTLSVAYQRLSNNDVSVSTQLMSMPLTSIHGDSVMVQFKGTLISNDYKQICVDNPSFTQNPLDWMKTAFEEKLFSDAQINVGQETFKLHKVILASASQVFKKMFGSDMQEKNGVINISDFDSAVIFDVLTYIYTGEAPNLKTLAKELLFAADKYDLQGLVFICMQQLETNLTFDNVAEVLVLLLADKLSFENPLRNNCIKFIQENFASVSQSKSWQSLMEASQDLAVQSM